MVSVLRKSLSLLPLVAGLCAAQSPGTVTFIANLNGTLVNYTVSPTQTVKQWFQSHFASMIVYPPYFNSRLSWFPNGFLYEDLYAIAKGSSNDVRHPEWVLRDSLGNKLYIPYGCAGGTCAQYAGDVGNPAFRQNWIANASSMINGNHYPGIFIDDVNMNFQVSDGNGNFVTPIDSNTGMPMTWDAWRGYIATFVEEVRAALPGIKFFENSVWYAGPAGVYDADPYIQRQIATTDILCVERGVASDPGLLGGTGHLSVYDLFNYIDRVHALGKSVNLLEYTLDAPGQQYGLASYFMISNGNDSIGDSVTNPDYWYSGYSVDLGAPLGPRTYKTNVFTRNFTGGMVLLGDPYARTQTISLGGTYTTLDGTQVTSVTIGAKQGYVLQTVPPFGVANAASFTAGAIAPGEIISILGTFTVTNPQVLVNGVQATVLAATPTQLNVIVPFGLDTSGPAKIQVQGSTSYVPVAQASPAIFTVNASGTGPGAILNQDYSLNSASNPAPAGSVLMVYATGLGTLNPPPSDGAIAQDPAPITSPVSAQVGGVSAQVQYAGAAPGLVAGVFQVNIQVPSGVQSGTVPITIQVGSVTSSTAVTVAIQ
jgi:uncharacterized protein (TIGR03437 family)